MSDRFPRVRRGGLLPAILAMLAILVTATLFPAAPLLAQPAPPQQAPSQPAPSPSSLSSAATGQPPPEAPDPLRIQLPAVTVTAQKEPSDVQKLPVSVTAVPADWLWNAGIRTVSDAAIYAPNTFFSEFSARKLSNARFRGIGSSPANPGITTYIDGVPQLNTNSSSIELMDVDQIEFVRGPQSALFGRNTLGGLVNVTSRRPSLERWSGSLSTPGLGDFGASDVRGTLSGPLVADTLALGVAIGHSRREGYTVNDVTGNDLDHRSATFGKVQLRWTPTRAWESRVIVNGERARDGDYALTDLAALRERPFHAARDFEGFTDRDLFSTTIVNERKGARIALSTTTGFVRWKTRDLTDLDYTPLPLIRRDNSEKDFQFTQEVRLASSDAAPIALSETAALEWQTGLFLFTQNYEQDAINTFSPGLIAESVTFPVNQHSPAAQLDDIGVGVFGQGTVTFKERLDLTAGLRVDYERKEATLETFFDPPIAPGGTVIAHDSFANASPQVAVAYRLRPTQMVYASVGRGFKAGGFNPASPAGSETYGDEQTWHVEGGVKTSWADGRVWANAAVFSIDWADMQLNVPNPDVPAQFYITNVGSTASRGVELELHARAAPGVDLFGAFGYTHARFKDGSRSSGVDVAGNEIPTTPDYTTTIGAQLAHALHASALLYGRAEVVFYGGFQYNDRNTAGQEAYSLANFRAGVRGTYLFGEAWVRNAFDTRYIPLAIEYESFAPSGFVGESGAPRRFGISGGIAF